MFQIQTLKPCAVTLALEMPEVEEYDGHGVHILKGSPEWAATYFENVKHDAADEDDITWTDKKLAETGRHVSGIFNEVKLSYTQKLSVNTYAESNREWNVWLSLVQMVGACVTSLGGMIYVKTSLLN